MKTIAKLPALVLALAAAALAEAHSFKLGDIDIEHPYARATAPGQPTGGGYLKLDNKGRDDRLVSARAAVSASVELHSMRMESDVMRMRQVDGIALPRGKQVALEPGGLHIMFVGLKAPLKAGDKFPMTLTFEKAGAVEVIVNVETPKPAAGSAAEHKH